MDDLISRETVENFVDNMPSELTEDGRRMIRQIRFKEFIADCPSAFDEMTNGEVIKALFPNMKVHEYTEKVVLNGLGDEFQIQSMAWKNWWNAPYKRVSE